MMLLSRPIIARGSSIRPAAITALSNSCSASRPAISTSSVVVDCESGPVRLGLAGALAQALGAEYLGLDELGDLSVGTLAGSVRAYRREMVA